MLSLEVARHWGYAGDYVRAMRPLESGQVLADFSKARRQLGWEPIVGLDDGQEDGCGTDTALEGYGTQSGLSL